jgi:hypothetical protein
LDLLLENLLVPVETDSPGCYLQYAAKALALPETETGIIKVLYKKLDYADPAQFYYKIALAVRVPDNYANPSGFMPYQPETCAAPKRHSVARKPIIVGFGPAGMFAALELLERGIKPLIFERGKKVEDRLQDIARFNTEQVLDEESNIQFGEGGAGTCSDGKLFSRRHNSAATQKVLATFIKFGAPAEIAYRDKPHLGTDTLCRIVKNMREHILAGGGEIFYSAKVTGLIRSDGKLRGVTVNDGREYLADTVFLATGHSARDTFALLQNEGMALEPRPFSVGARLEHPAALINRLRYGEKYKDLKSLGAAVYSLTYTDRAQKRGAYTFCMCPGGEIVNASSQDGFIALNGMSYAARAGEYSNAAIAVTCRPEDYNSPDPLAGMEFQRAIERKAFLAGGGNWKVPAQNLEDFLARRETKEVLQNSCKTGAAAADLRAVLPDFVCNLLADAFAKWKEEAPGFVSARAVLLAPETRTTSPVRMTRDENYDSLNIKNLCPIGEGAGYAGGITSSASDAIRAVEKRFSA